mgnify:CR=1 FL=1
MPLKWLVNVRNYKNVLTDQVATALEEALHPKGRFLSCLKAEHMCMTMRGIKKPSSKTVTTVAKGIFKENREERNEILSLILGK